MIASSRMPLFSTKTTTPPTSYEITSHKPNNWPLHDSLNPQSSKKSHFSLRKRSLKWKILSTPKDAKACISRKEDPPIISSNSYGSHGKMSTAMLEFNINFTLRIKHNDFLYILHLKIIESPTFIFKSQLLSSRY
jgi:hypothetical protein